MIVLQYDPYRQTAEFKHENEETGVVSELEDLEKEQKDALEMLEENIILQNQIENLIKVLKDIDSRQRFRFIGTVKDYQDFKAGLKELAPSGCVEKSDTPFFYEPRYIRKQLQEICGTVRQDVDALNKKYPEYCESLHFDSSELDTMLADRTPLVFMGSGSVGKSSVINAIVGAEILPTADGTTTEFVCEIVPDDSYVVSCKQNGSVYKIELNGTRADAEANLNAALPTEICLDTENPYDWVYTAVKALSKQKNIKELQVRVPFKNLTDISSRIVIYDTPGPDSKTCKNHKEILNAALGRFKKGVAVFVIKYTDVEKTNLRSFLKEYTDNSEQLLDILNVNAGIVIVNGADGTNLSKIEEGKKSRDQHLKQAVDDGSKLDFLYEQDRMIYFSSPFALGVQKDAADSWEDSKFEELNSPVHVKMYDASSKFYLPLAKAAELPILRKQAIVQAYEKAEKRYLDDKSDENRKELIAHNSGLRALESEIGFVVKKLSICNLCAQAQKQLEDVLRSVQENSEKIGLEITRQAKQAEKILDSKYKDILGQLFKNPDSALESAIKGAKAGVAKQISPDEDVLSAINKEVKETIIRQWHKVKSNPKCSITNIILNSSAMAKVQAVCNAKADQFYRTSFERFKNDCEKIVEGPSNLSQEEQTALKVCVKNWHAVRYDFSNIKIRDEDVTSKFLLFKFTSKPKCLQFAESAVSQLVRELYLTTRNTVIELFRASCVEAKRSFYTEDRIKTLNPELRELSGQIDRLTKQKDDYENFQYETEAYLTMVNNLTTLQQKGEE